jgi:hypothetical protein
MLRSARADYSRTSSSSRWASDESNGLGLGLRLGAKTTSRNRNGAPRGLLTLLVRCYGRW